MTSADPLCQCGHQMTQGRCWRLTCPTNGARQSAKLARPGPFHMKQDLFAPLDDSRES